MRNRTILYLLLALAGLMVLATLNRKGIACFPILGRQIGDGFRVNDYIVTLVLAPLAVIVLYLIYYFRNANRSLGAMLLFLLGIYLIGMNFGMHEPTNFLVARYKGQIPESLHRSLVFFDDELGHYVFFAGFAFIALAGILVDLASPLEEPLSRFATALLTGAGLAVAAAVYVNMVREETRADIAVLASVSLIGLALHWRHGWISLRRLPHLLMVYAGLGVGALATLIAWGVARL
jgi:hypothetical protein